jgi:hypothetical protein
LACPHEEQEVARKRQLLPGGRFEVPISQTRLQSAKNFSPPSFVRPKRLADHCGQNRPLGNNNLPQNVPVSVVNCSLRKINLPNFQASLPEKNRSEILTYWYFVACCKKFLSFFGISYLPGSLVKNLHFPQVAKGADKPLLCRILAGGRVYP